MELLDNESVLGSYVLIDNLNTLNITTFRLLTASLSIPLTHITKLLPHTSLWTSPSLDCNYTIFKSWKCQVCSEINEDLNGLGKCVKCGVIFSRDGAAAEKSFELKFKGKVDLKEVIKLIESQTAKLKTKKSESQSVGINRVLKDRAETQRKYNETISSESFRDLDSLMKKADEMMKLASAADVQLAFEPLPIASTPSKTNLDFYDSIAIALSTFLDLYSVQSKQEQHNMMDLFCIFNRSRSLSGLPLVSPHDLIVSCERMNKMESLFEMESVSSGVKIVRRRILNNELIDQEMIDTLSDGKGWSLIELVKKLGQSGMNERIRKLEYRGFIWRDESIQGVLYYIPPIC